MLARFHPAQGHLPFPKAPAPLANVNYRRAQQSRDQRRRSPSPSHARATPPRIPPPSPGRVARAASRDTRSAHLVISSRAAFARSVFLPRWWRSSLGDYGRRQGLWSSPAPRRPSCARLRTRPRSFSLPHHASPLSLYRRRWRLLLLLFGVARRPRPPLWIDRGSSRSAPTSRLPRLLASWPRFPEEKRGSRMRPGGGASERERGGGGRRRWTRATRTSEAAAAGRAAAHARGRGQVSAAAAAACPSRSLWSVPPVPSSPSGPR